MSIRRFSWSSARTEEHILRRVPELIQSATKIEAQGHPPKIIEEYFGRVNSGSKDVSIAQMKAPAGWVEPGQRPEFDEYTLVLDGLLRVEHEQGVLDVAAGQAVLTRKGEWVTLTRSARAATLDCGGCSG